MWQPVTPSRACPAPYPSGRSKIFQGIGPDHSVQIYLERLRCQISCGIQILHHKSLGIGPWGPALVCKYAGVRFGTYASGNMLNEQESKLLAITCSTPWLEEQVESSA